MIFRIFKLINQVIHF